MSPIVVAGQAMWVPAGAFFQTNVRMLERLLERIDARLEGSSFRRAADVYGGAGTFGLALAPRVERMSLVELDASAVEAAARTASDRGLTNLTCMSRHAETALPDLAALDLVIVDPPRTGLGEAVTGALAGSSASAVIYVSCAPQSLARDLAALQSGGFEAVALEMFDFYPQTYHVECLAILHRAG
jgi:23S rRNA (uracil1939-C5)-methyltransferase